MWNAPERIVEPPSARDLPGPCESHLWLIEMACEPCPAQTVSLLDEAERVRLARLRTSAQQAQYTRTRVALRCILAAYLDASPAAITFGAGPLGKPLLLNGALQFNLSHCDGLALIAISRTRAVGVDCEPVRPVDIAALVSVWASPEESLALKTEAQAQSGLAHLRSWTRKEALLKAWGDGFFLSPRRVSVPLRSTVGEYVVSGCDATRPACRLVDLPLPPAWVGSLAICGTERCRISVQRSRASASVRACCD